MKKLLFGLAALPLIVGNAWAAELLNDAQLDRVTAGALPSCAGASMCSGISVMQSSTTFTTTNSNGVVTTTTTNTGPVTTPLGGGESSGTGGNTGGTGGNTGGTGGNTGGTGGNTGGTGGIATGFPGIPVFPSTIAGPPGANILVTAPSGLPGT